MRCGRCGPGRRRPVYRPRGGLFLGVCQGLAWRLGLPAWVLRAFTVLLFFALGWPVLIAYLALGLLLRPEPDVGRTVTVDGTRLTQAAREIRERTGALEARIARMESRVTSKEFDFDRRLGAAGRGDNP